MTSNTQKLVDNVLAVALDQIGQLLADFASSSDVWEKLTTAFGDKINLDAARSLLSAWENGDVSSIPEIEVRSSQEINRANGAFSIATGKIYLSQEFLLANQNNIDRIKTVIIEEIGHSVDARLNLSDTRGDEGELFSALVGGIQIGDWEIERIRNEDDRATVTLDGKNIEIEQSSYDLGVIEGNYSRDDTAYIEDYEDYYTFEISQVGASDSYISIYSDSENVDFQLYLFDALNNLIYERDVNNYENNYEQISLEGLTPGTYTLKVSDYYNGQNLTTSGAPYVLNINTPIGIVSDRFESNETLTTAKDLGSISGLKLENDLSINTDTDEDWFKFTISGQANDEHYVRIEFDNSTSSGDLDIALYNSQNEIVRSSSGTGDSENISLGGLTAGNYYLRIYGYSGSTNNYNLTFNTPEIYIIQSDRFESNETFDTAKDLGSIGGFKQENNLSINTGTDEDWFKFSLSQQGTDQHYVRINFDDSTSTGDLDIALYNAQGQLIDYSNGVGDSENISLGSLTAGTYYLRVYGYSGDTNNYNLTFNAPGTTSSIVADRFESNGGNNTRQTATYLKDFNWTQQVGFQSWENLSVGTSDQDWFKFDLHATGTANNYLGISFDTYQGDLDLELYNSAGTLIKSAKGFRNIESISLEGYTAGTYYARVIGFANKTNPNYTLFIDAPGSDRFEDNDTKDQATILNRTKTLQTWENLSLDDEDWFKITLPIETFPSQTISINFDHSQGDIDLELYKSDGTLVASATGVGNTESISLPRLIHLLGPSDYFIRVFGYNGATNPSYSLTVDVPLPNLGDWLEDNDTQATATDLNARFSQQLEAGQQFIQLGTDTDKSLSIDRTGDVDWFKFTIASAGKLGDYAAISFDHTAGDLDLELYNSSGQLIRSSKGIANVHSIDLKGLAAGTYSLKVFGYQNATNSAYSLSVQAPFVNKTGDWSESNNTQATAKDLGTIVDEYSKGNLSIHSTSDVDWFKFNLAATGGIDDAIGINFDGGKGDLDIELYKADGVTLISKSTGVTGTEQISLNTLVAGTYYLKVLGYNGATNPDYSLSIEAPENVNGDWAEQNNTVATARDLRNVEGFQTWNTLSVHNTTDVDWFKFTTTGTGDANDFVRIAFDQSLGDLELYLYNAAGTTVLKKSETIDGVEEVSLQGLAAGTYLVQVKGYNNASNPSYQLAINAPNSSTPPLDWADRSGNKRNEIRTDAEDLLKLEGTNVFSGLSIHQGNDQDWFKFETVGTGIASNAVSINFDRTKGDLKLELYNSAGTLIASSNENSNRELISLAGKVAGVYYLRVLGNTTAITNPSYALTIDVPDIAEADWIDKGAKPNSTLANAYDLRNINGALALNNLSIHATTDQDWYKVVVNQKNNSNQFARIDFNNDEGNLKLELLNASGVVLATSETGENFEQISLAGRDVGTYYVKVSGAVNPDYRLTVQGIPDTVADALEGVSDNPKDAYQLRDLVISGGRSYYEDLRPSARARYDKDASNKLYKDTISGTYASEKLGIDTYDGTEQVIYNAANSGGTLVGNLFHQPKAKLGNVYVPVKTNTYYGPNFYRIDNSKYRSNEPPSYPDNPIVWNFPQVNNIIPEYQQPIFNEVTQNSYSNTFNYLDDDISLEESSPDIIDSFDSEEQSATDSIDNDYAIAETLLSLLISLFSGEKSSSSENFSIVPNLSINSTTDKDWFKFTLSAEGEDGQFIGLNFDNDLGNLQLELFEAFNTTTNTTEAQYQTYLVDRANGNGDSEQISLAGLAKGDYLVRVSGVNSATNPNYNLIFNAPPALEKTGDWAEKGTVTNNTSATAYNLKTVEGGISLSGLTLHTATDTDWFQFTTTSAGKAGHKVRLDFAQNLGDLDLILYNSDGTTVRGRSETTENFEEINLDGIAAGTYKVQVLGYKGATNPNYALSVFAPNGTTNPINPDFLEPNSSFTTATNLDLANKLSVIPGLTIHQGDTDFFKFTTTKTGTAANFLSINFEHAQGDLQLELYGAGNTTTPLRFSRGTSNNETISLAGLAAGTYYAKILGNGTTVANSYDFHLDAPTEAAQTKDEWTMFVYMTGSDLAESAFRDINELEYAASLLPSNVNLVALWDQSSLSTKYATGTNPAWGDTGWAVIRPDADKDKIATTFTLLGEKNTGDPNTLVSFLNTAKIAAPANKYGLIMWDHGGGDLGGFNVDNEGIRSNTTADRLYANELATALNTVKTGGLNLDLLAFDACLMGMAEVAFALSPYSKVFVASQESEGDTGYDYTTAFSALLGNPSQVTASDLANSLIASYQQQYQGDRRNWDTLSATDTSKMAAFASSLKTFTTAANAITTASTWDALHDARDAATSFFQNPNYRDLGQFLKEIYTSSNTALTSLKTSAQNAYNALNALVINQTLDRRNTEGLSVYLPNSGAIDTGYINRNSAFFTATGWNTFLNAFLTRGTNNGNTLALDWAESNEVAPRAYNFNTLIGDGYTFNGLSIHKPSDTDWYRFTIQGTGTTTDKVALTYSNANSQRLLATLYRTGSNGDRIQVGTTSNTGTGTETLSLNTLTSGEYWIKVTGNGTNSVPQYAVKFDTPGTVTNGNDWALGNDKASKAEDLGIISARSLFTGLQVSSSAPDFFEFETPKNQIVEPGSVYIQVAGTQAVTAELYQVNGTTTGKFLNSQTGTGRLQVNYSDIPGQKYWLKITQSTAATPAGYSLNFGLYNTNITGGGLSDILTGGSQADAIVGAAGNDTLYGNGSNDVLNGGLGNDTLNGGLGADTMIGGLGNDLYYVDNIGDVVTETSTLASEIDRVASTVSYTLGANVEALYLQGTGAINGTGNALNNTLFGNASNNVLNGGLGADTMIGGLGNDLYYIDNIGDVVTETSTLASEIDRVASTVSYTLGANLEFLYLQGTGAINGTGNALNNTIVGNSANNTLNGGLGADTMIGGLGNDLYYVDNVADAVTETSTLASEIDRVASTVSYTLGANVEALYLQGTGAINGTGNALNNTLFGNASNNVLNGGLGADTMIGGLGNDLYYVDNVADVVTETSTLASEIDRVASTVSYTLGANVEALYLQGTGAINGTGNALNNTIVGNSANNTLNGSAGNDSLIGGLGNDILVGGSGNDALTGGAGNDIFRFNNKNEGIDAIADFTTGSDILQISASGFGGGLVAGTLSAQQILIGSGATAANSASQRFIYNTTNGSLFFDADGNGSGSAVQIATLSNKAAITNNDFLLIV